MLPSPPTRGGVVDTQGDSFFVAFRTAADAVAAAVDAQRDLAAERWPHGGAVRVRMGLHTGEPRMGEQRYVGIGVHRAARIGAAGHGGQVLLSSTTRELAEEDLPPGVSIRDLGERRLKPPPLACSPDSTRGTGRVVEEHRSERSSDSRGRRSRRRVGCRQRGRNSHSRRSDGVADADHGRRPARRRSRSAQAASGWPTEATTPSFASIRAPGP